MKISLTNKDLLKLLPEYPEDHICLTKKIAKVSPISTE